MVGISHQSDHGGGISNSDTSLITAIGGGVDYKLIPAVAWRLQGDELHTRLFGAAQDHFRFSTGIVVRFRRAVSQDEANPLGWGLLIFLTPDA
jgi:hypothetical protein